MNRKKVGIIAASALAPVVLASAIALAVSGGSSSSPRDSDTARYSCPDGDNGTLMYVEDIHQWVAKDDEDGSLTLSVGSTLDEADEYFREAVVAFGYGAEHACEVAR